MQDPIITPRAFFERVVAPDCNDVFHTPNDVRLVFHACTSLHHLKEWVFQAGISGFKTLQDFNTDLNSRCPALIVIRELAVNAKHYPPGSADVMEIGVSSMPITYGSSMYGTLAYGNRKEDQVIAKTLIGRTEALIPTISDAYRFWQNEFKAKGW